MRAGRVCADVARALLERRPEPQGQLALQVFGIGFVLVGSVWLASSALS